MVSAAEQSPAENAQLALVTVPLGMSTSFKSPDQSSPHREAAFFYALFLRGHGIESLRRDIDVPQELFSKWMRSSDFEPPFRESLQRMYDYRKQVLAIFDSLVSSEATLSRLQ